MSSAVTGGSLSAESISLVVVVVVVAAAAAAAVAVVVVAVLEPLELLLGLLADPAEGLEQ